MPVSRNICLINFENRLSDFQSKCSGGRRFCNFKVNVPWRNTLFFPATLHGPCQKPAWDVAIRRAIPLNARLLRTLGIPWISQFVFSKVPKCLPRPQRLCAWTPLRSRPNSQQQSNQAEAEATLRTAHKSCHYFQVSKILAISIFIKCSIPVQCEMQVRRTIVSHRFESLIFV